MIRQIIRTIFFILLISSRIFSQPQTNFNISTGSTDIDEILNEKLISEFSGAAFDEKKAKSIVSGFLNAQGYFNASVEVRSVNEMHSVKVDLGRRFMFRTILIRGAENDSVHVAGLGKEVSGGPFTSRQVENLMDRIAEYFEIKGFAFAEVELSSINILKDYDPPSVDIVMMIKKNERSLVDSIVVKGNTKTKREIIIRALGIAQGVSYNSALINNTAFRINRLKFFKPVNAPNYYITASGKGILEVYVDELNTNNIDGILGYVPSSNDNSDGYFTGLIDVSLRNLFGTGRGFWFKWERENRESQNLELKYLEPWALSFPINVQFDFHQRQQDTTYVSRKVGGELEYLATETISAGISIESASVIPTINSSGVMYVSNSSLLTAGVNVKIDTRDDFYSPTRGLYFKNAYFYSSKKINSADVNTVNRGNAEPLQKIELDFSIYREFFSRQVAALGVYLRQVKGGLLEISEAYRFGGTNSVRGYRENQFTANRLIYSNAEYRFLLSPRTFFSIFYDSGYYELENDVLGVTETLSGFIFGYGIGINLETGLGVLKVNYAIGKGDAVNEGKIQFGLLNEF